MAVLQAQRQTGLPCRALIKSVKCGGRGSWWRRAVEEKRNRKGSYAISVPRGFLCHLEKANKENNVVGVEFISGERERKKGSSVRKGLRHVRKGWPAHSDRLRQKPLPRRQEAGSSGLSFMVQLLPRDSVPFGGCSPRDSQAPGLPAGSSPSARPHGGTRTSPLPPSSPAEPGSGL